MKEVYLVFIASDYRIGKMIRRVTGTEYNHVALAAQPNLSVMYSFARKHNKTPLVGGFVTELPHRYTKRKSSDPHVKVCRIDVSDEEYSAMCSRFLAVSGAGDHMKYNYLSAMVYPFHHSVPVHNAFTCVEFVQFVLDISGFVSFEDLQKKYSDCVIYKGGIRGVAVSDGTTDDYYKYKLQTIGFACFLRDFFCVLFRFVFKRKRTCID